ncbi:MULTISPECIES: hypothetical protein [unclassified Colwellia]|uniref:hypothetical protein n=1 Tax=unclassified Colwellia TaxID=196834 RepID=UPI0015F4E758|nr:MULTISPECIES: hypothetical protein [unclassified Colwellia]MBA6233726.1 hypothetical protein [Colwellia sp. MB02u-7]MBA6237892.1 hypothetical protein [Colwellia sp. MB02u-11]MBA6257207.1 hypothetical protein [Colwellia sp. MB3u-28]MBA6258792.1 hypothetical protein [Colwellia sp. MB3u-41]MBA6300457.1 hypothetical protein [Colwellia sp. MB3u-22]
MTIPIPHRASGFLLGDAAAQISINAFINIQCPHSRIIWPTPTLFINNAGNIPVNDKSNLAQ